MKYYNRTNTCDRCKEEKLIPGKAIREYNEEKNWTGNWLCESCRKKERYKNGDTNANLIKEMRDRRTGNPDPNSPCGKGDLFQELTCKWRSTISTIPVEDLNIINDNYTTGTPIDHTRDSELGIIQTKGRLYDFTNRWWHLSCLEREWYKEFDYLICYCASKDGKRIERVYIFPKWEILTTSGVSIVKYDSKGNLYEKGWYEQYRVKDEETIKKVNKIWKEIIKDKK